MPSHGGVTVVLDNVARVMEGIAHLTTKDVLVGIPNESPNRRSGTISNAALGYIHENGAPEVNIPARPFLIPGVKAVRKQTIESFKKAGEYALNGRPEAVERELHRIGLVAQNSVRATINAGVPPPLKPSTLAARRARGRKGTVPLIDTGQLRNSITYVIRDHH